MERNWNKDLKKYEKFLKMINLNKYSYLREIKTVEQDLPYDLLPLEIFYRYYWDNMEFKDYDEVFEIYWKEKLNNIYSFIKKYFYGCSLQFVEEGFKARLYRIWMSILTQFHFQYLWNALFDEKLESTPDLDMIGIDAIVVLKNKKIGFQIKKISYRREASERRFTKRQKKYVDFIVEVPYLVIDVDDLKNKISNPRVKEETKNKYRNFLRIFEENFTKLNNGFVIFKSNYLEHIRNVIEEKLNENIEKIPYFYFLI